MGTTGPESLSAAANIFVGQTEAPLVIKPYVDKMHKSELHAVMTGGFATVAGLGSGLFLACHLRLFHECRLDFQEAQ